MLFLAVLLCFAAARPAPKSIETAPYNLRRTETLLALKDAVKEGQSWYVSELATLIENNGGSTDPNVLNPALDRFFKVYCKPPYFKGFHGITGTSEIFTNISQVRELYKEQVIIAGAGATFNVVFDNPIVTFPEVDQPRDRRAVYANLTAFNRHYIRVANQEGGMDVMLVLGYYINQWRIDADGNMCISRFYDAFLKIFRLDYDLILSIPWDL